MTVSVSRPSPGSLPIVGSPALPRGFLSAGETAAGRVYLNPLGLGGMLPLPQLCEVLVRYRDRVEITVASPAEVGDWAAREGAGVAAHVGRILEHWRHPPRGFAGLGLDRPLIMGIVNVTPDSFSDAGETLAPEAAVARGLQLREQGADIVDVGGESTRPGASPVAPAEELARVLPVVAGLAREGVVVSIDTRHAAVMAAALDAGARIVNDVTALAGDPDAPKAAARAAGVVLMHMQGEPATMQRDPRYGAAPLDVHDRLAERLAACERAGFTRDRLAVDPGIGFGKRPAHNFEILARLGVLRGLGAPILVGASRKLGSRRPGQGAEDRIGGSLAAALAAVARGAGIVRVHDVGATRQALDVWQAVQGAA